MKKIWRFVLLGFVLLTTGICAAEVPDLLGRWAGLGNGYVERDGSSKLMENGSINFAIVEQKGRLFTGNMTYALENGTEIVEGFAGAIGLDNRTLYVVEFNGGYDLGTIISDDEIELTYLDDGETAEMAIERLYRTKA